MIPATTGAPACDGRAEETEARFDWGNAGDERHRGSQKVASGVFAVTLVLAVPFWILSTLVKGPSGVPMNLP